MDQNKKSEKRMKRLLTFRASTEKLRQQKSEEEKVKIRAADVIRKRSRTVVSASKNQADFPNSFAGVQCCAMAVSSCAFSLMKNGSDWTEQDLDKILSDGNRLYQQVMDNSTSMPDFGYLNVGDFDVIKDKMKLFEQEFTIDSLKDLNGAMSLDSAKEAFGPLVGSAVDEWLALSKTAVFTNGSKCYGMFSQGDAYFLFDSHACDEKGKPDCSNGKACLIKCKTVAALKKSLMDRKSDDIQYTLDAIHLETSKKRRLNDDDEDFNSFVKLSVSKMDAEQKEEAKMKIRQIINDMLSKK